MVGRLSRRYHAMSRVEISGILLSLTLLRRSAAFVGIFDVTESLAISGIISCSCDVPNPAPLGGRVHSLLGAENEVFFSIDSARSKCHKNAAAHQ